MAMELPAIAGRVEGFRSGLRLLRSVIVMSAMVVRPMM